MENRRFNFCDRRQRKDMPKIPFRDNRGVTNRENRRSISNRRMDDYEPVVFNESDIP